MTAARLAGYHFNDFYILFFPQVTATFDLLHHSAAILAAVYAVFTSCFLLPCSSSPLWELKQHSGLNLKNTKISLDSSLAFLALILLVLRRLKQCLPFIPFLYGSWRLGLHRRYSSTWA